jgi:hypothetical protein
MTFLELAKHAMGGCSDEAADFVLWNRTPFPFDPTPRTLYKKIAGYRRACANERKLCMFCSNVTREGEWECQRCGDALAAARE